MHFQSRAVVAKNRLYISLKGFFGDEQAKMAADKVIEDAKSLAPNFDIINDLDGFKPGTPAAALEIKRAQEFLLAKGVGRTIRVIGADPLSKMQHVRISKETGFKAEYATSIEEAERMLDNKK